MGQYNACECSASSGRCLKQGECLGEELDLIVRVTEGSEFLASVIPFASNKNFYFTSECVKHVLPSGDLTLSVQMGA